MLAVSILTPEFSVGPQIVAEDIAGLRDLGFASILNVRPDDELGEYLTADEAHRIAGGLGLAYSHVPTPSHSIFELPLIDQFEQALLALPKPIFSHCKSGTRAAMLWGLVAVRHISLDETFATLNNAGHDLTFLEDELRASAEEVVRSPLQLKDDGLMSLGRSPLLRR